jgi:hypothetical protein
VNIIFVNGINHDPQWRPYEEALEAIKTELEDHSVSLEYFPIREMNFGYCQGCWDCWTKTPGRCRLKDEGEKYLKAFSKADKILFFSPIVAGFISSETKRALDRFIPNVLPHITIYRDECHHVQRYPGREPELGIVLLGDRAQKAKESEMIFRNFDRIQRNMRTEKAIRSFISPDSNKELVDEILSA